MVADDRTSRRFTEREVALVLKQASEMDESAVTDGGRGLSLEDLQEIAREVGISDRAISEAVAGLEREHRPRPSLKSAPLVRRAVRAVPCRLDEAAIARLVRLIDERTDSAGAVSEVLGSIRWTSSERLRSTQVTITPDDGETTIHAVEKATPRLRRIVHMVPVASAAMLVSPLIATLDLTDASEIGVAMMAMAIAGGAAVGRLAWNWISERSEGRVKRLASELTDRALAE